MPISPDSYELTRLPNGDFKIIMHFPGSVGGSLGRPEINFLDDADLTSLLKQAQAVLGIDPIELKTKYKAGETIVWANPKT